MNLTDVFFNANKCLVKLTKIRCSINSISPSLEKKDSKIYGWPLPFEKDKKVLDYLDENGIYKDENLNVKTYEISYQDYKKLHNCKPININYLKHLRSCIVIYRLINAPKGEFEIGLSWDQHKYRNTDLPTNTNDVEKIYDIENRRDIQYTINHLTKNWYLKAPAFLGPIVFSELNLFSNQNLIFKDIRTIKGKNTDKDGRSYRIIINESNVAKLNIIITDITTSIKKLLPNDPWVDLVYNATMKYYNK